MAIGTLTLTTADPTRIIDLSKHNFSNHLEVAVVGDLDGGTISVSRRINGTDIIPVAKSWLDQTPLSITSLLSGLTLTEISNEQELVFSLVGSGALGSITLYLIGFGADFNA